MSAVKVQVTKGGNAVVLQLEKPLSSVGGYSETIAALRVAHDEVLAFFAPLVKVSGGAPAVDVVADDDADDEDQEAEAADDAEPPTKTARAERNDE
jgi:hypothetical protein